MRRTVVLALLCVAASAPAYATPFTVNFTGYLVLFDLTSPAPEFWALRDALAANGVYAGGVVYEDGPGNPYYGGPIQYQDIYRTPSPVYMTVTFDSLPSWQVTSSGQFINAQYGQVLSSRFSFGPFQFFTGPAQLSDGFATSVVGSKITFGGVEASPTSIDFGISDLNFTGDPAADLANVWNWRFDALFTWGSPFQLAFYNLTPTSVSVPEPSTFALMASLSRTNSQVQQAPPVRKDRSSDRGIKGLPRLCVVPSSFSSTITNTARTSGRFPARIVLRLRGRNDLSFQLSVGHAFNMTRGPSMIGP
jgi:hypothetical protein